MVLSLGNGATRDGAGKLARWPLGRRPVIPLDARALTERLIRYDTSDPEGIRKAAGFVKGWLESRDIPVEELEIRGPAGAGRARSAPARGPTVVLHGHLDVVPGARGAVRARASRATGSTAAAPTT